MEIHPFRLKPGQVRVLLFVCIALFLWTTSTTVAFRWCCF